MLTIEERKNLKPGDKLIFVQPSGVLMGRPGEVYTFCRFKTWEMSNEQSVCGIPEHWRSDYADGQIIQLQEFIDQGNWVHGYYSYCFEIFDPNKHKNWHYVTADYIKQRESDFIHKFG